MKSLMRRAGLVVVLVTTVTLCVPASATQDDMEQLPEMVTPYQCLICHQTNPGDTGDVSLNPFGADFLANLRVWDLALANLNSDGDDCSNGVELGDTNGDGENDGNVNELQSNPGVNDCAGASVDNQTWGELKALFGSN